MSKKPTNYRHELRVELVRWAGTNNYVYRITSENPQPSADLAWADALELAVRINTAGVKLVRVDQ